MTNTEPEPVCKFEQGCHRVVPCDPGCAAPAAVSVPPPAPRADAEAVDEPPLSPDYEHPDCGFHWHGRDGMDIPMRDGQPVCPRCELRRVEKLLDHRECRCDELRAESKRRGKVKLEYAEKIRLLERQIDEVRRQLGAEILRAGQAEAELRRMAAASGPCVAGEQQNETPEEAHPPTHTWKVESPRRDKWASWGATYDERDWASERYESAIEHASGRAFRLVRATTTYTVEAEHTPAVEASE